MADEQRRTVGAVAASLAALLLAAPRPRETVTTLGALGAATDPTAPVVAVVALAAWTVAGWLAVTVLLVLASRLPGLLGRVVGALARRVAPAAVRRAVEAAFGLTVAVGVLAPTAALAAPVAGPPAVTSADGGWDLDWPDVLATPDPAATAAPAPASSRPAPAASSVAPTPLTVRPTALPTVRRVGPVVRPVSPTARPVTPSVPQAPPVRPAPAAVVVRAGDSLWSVAESSLRGAGTAPTDRQVAQAWPRWWAANREAVGDDPDLLLPGTVLRPPDAPP